MVTLVSYRGHAPHAARAHPIDDHLMPPYVVPGSAGVPRAEPVHASVDRGVMSMDAYVFL